MKKNEDYNHILPYHITSRCSNKEWFKIPISNVWHIMEDYLYFISHAYNVHIFSFVLMSNHFHLIAKFPDDNISPSMNYFLRETSRQINYSANTINHIYKKKFYRSLIEGPIYFNHAYKYVYRNPVEAGVCKRVEDYPYSTLYGLLGKSRSIIPVRADETLFSDVSGTLEWLNTKPNEHHYVDLKRAMRRKKLSFQNPRAAKCEHDLDWMKY